MKRLQQGVLLAGVLALSQLAACSSIGWKNFGFGNSPMPAQATTSPVAAGTSAPPATSAGASAPADASVTASAAGSGAEPAGKN